MKRTSIYILLLITLSCNVSKSLLNDSDLEFYEKEISRSINKGIITKKAILLLNDSIIIETNKINQILINLSFDSISSLSIIESEIGKEIFGSVAYGGIIFIVTNNYLKRFNNNQDTIKFKDVNKGINPLFFYDNITFVKQDLKDIDPQEIAAIEILQKDVYERYFKEGIYDGAVFITSKEYAVKLINERFSRINKEFKKLNAEKIKRFENIIFINNDSILNNNKGYIGALFNYNCQLIKELKIISSDIAQDRFEKYDQNKKYIIEIREK